MNQKIAEPHAAIMIPASTYDLIITPQLGDRHSYYTADPTIQWAYPPSAPTMASGMSAVDAVDGASSAASKCYRLVCVKTKRNDDGV
jgi:hypothetical protein